MNAMCTKPFPVGPTDLLLTQFQADRKEFASLVESGPKEQAIQAFLETHPVLLLHAMLDGFYPVGSEYEADFAYCNGNSMGVWWTFVELERADVPLFNKSGDPSKYLTHAVRQVLDWQAWVSDHEEYACSQLMRLLDDHPLQWHWRDTFRRLCNGLIVIGRRAGLTRQTNRLRAEMCAQNPSIEIMTYDRLFDDYGVDKDDSLDEYKDQMRTMREYPL
jgi:hypothetical protein